jgi:hypothetical protein
MNKTYLVIGGAVIAAIVGFVLFGQGSAPTSPSPSASTVTDMAEKMTNGTMMKHSLRDFLTMGGSQKCTSVYEDQNARTNSIAYMAGGKVRTNSTITSKTDGTTMESSGIIDSEYMYAWGGAMSHGMKIQLATMEAWKTNAPQGDTMGMKDQAQNFDAKYDYSCEPWSADASFFAPPAGISFMDYGEMMQDMGSMMMDKVKAGGTKVDLEGPSDAGMMDGEMMDHSMMKSAPSGNTAAMCAACEQAPTAEAKAQCRAALQCK